MGKITGFMNNKILLQRRDMGRLVLAGALLLGAATAFVRPAYAADEAPDALVKRLSTDVIETIKADTSIKSGDISKIMDAVIDKLRDAGCTVTPEEGGVRISSRAPACEHLKAQSFSTTEYPGFPTDMRRCRKASR